MTIHFFGENKTCRQYYYLRNLRKHSKFHFAYVVQVGSQIFSEPKAPPMCQQLCLLTKFFIPQICFKITMELSSQMHPNLYIQINVAGASFHCLCLGFSFIKKICIHHSETIWKKKEFFGPYTG